MGKLEGLTDIVRGGVSFLLVLVVLIAVHELGHYLFARLFKMKVDAFAVMVGGVRKTSLSHLLDQPMVHSGRIWAIGGLLAIALVIGYLLQITTLIIIALGGLGIALPAWVVSRLAALYHVSLTSALGTLLKTWLGVYVLSLFATKLAGLPVIPFLGLLGIAGLVGTLIVYYRPVLAKQEETPQGTGQINTEHEGSVPVHYRPLWSAKSKGGTEFSLLCWPLGGFAAIKGMHPREDGSETTIEGGFYSKPPLARLLVLFAGPLFSILLGIALLASTLLIEGVPVSSNSPNIETVIKDGPAYKAGIKPGDRIVAANGSKVEKFFDAVKVIRSSYEMGAKGPVPVPVKLTVLRDGKTIDFSVTPILEESKVLDSEMNVTAETRLQAKISVATSTAYKPVSVVEALQISVTKPLEMVANIGSLFRKPAEIAENMGGPATIAVGIAQASKDGFVRLLEIAGLLSISLGVMNLLPIGPLDGGQMVVNFAELLRGGRRLSYRVQMTVSTVGAMLVFLLMVMVVTIDIGRIVPK